ncbi:MAG: hypothetical protein IKA64_05840 [Clostridia bacterium]|nr:hypothetical protein [Clostridia bacterium]
MNRFDLGDFRFPPREFAPMYGWTWNGPISKEETKRQIDKMRDFGIRAFYILPEPREFRPMSIPTELDPGYMTDAYLEQYKFAIDTAREYGMECWIYDEGGWPSGGACGRVMNEYPEYARRTLGVRRVTFSAGEAFKLSDSDGAAGFLDGRMLTEGEVFQSDVVVDEYFSERVAWARPGVPELPDLTRREATDAFLALTHERYRKCLGDHIGTTLSAVFTDEPEAPAIPFRRELCEIYEAEYGESILPYLPAILNENLRDGESLIRVRRWFDLSSRMFSENFLGRCRDWANKNGMKFTGHLNLENEPAGCMRGKNFHVMRALRSMDIPGIDVIWRQIYPGEPYDMCDPTGKFPDVGGFVCAENGFYPRYASSAAAQIGSRFAMTECYGVYGSGMTYDQMRYVAGFQAVRGVALFDPLMVVYYRRGYLMTGELPAFAEYHACGADLGVFNKYLERLSYISTIGERVCDTALYYPVNDYWGGVNADTVATEFDTLGRAMENRGVDFDVADDDVIAASDAIDSGLIRMGNACYRKIVIPPSAYIPERTAALLERFVRGGGTVCYAAEDVEPTLTLGTATEKIRVMKRVLENGELVCLFNEDDKTAELTLPTDNRKAYLLDINEGRILPLTSRDGAATLTLLSGDTVGVLFTCDTVECDTPRERDNSVELTGFTFRRTNSFIVGEKELESRDIEETAEPISLGPWADRVGIEFSGSGIYETSFERPAAGAVLDLGEVLYTAEVFLNGKSLGVRVMPPYTFELPSELLLDRNKLEIRVSNTPANQMQFTKSLDKWAPWQMTPYHERQLVFDRDSLESGLFGPVRILF